MASKNHRQPAVFRTAISLAALVLAFVNCNESPPASPDSPAPSRYVASGKLIIQWPANSNSGAFDTNGRTEFCGTVVQILESSELKRRALVRVRGLHPELKEVPMDAQATRVKVSAIIEVTASGPEPRYARVYLDALLDEFTAFTRDLFEKSGGSVPEKVIAEVLAREKAVKGKEQERAAFMKEHPADFDAGTNKAQYSILTLECKRLDEDYHKWVGTLDNFEKLLNSIAPVVAIMERPHSAEKAP